MAKWWLGLALVVGCAGCGSGGSSGPRTVSSSSAQAVDRGVTYGMAIDYGTGFQFVGLDGLVEMSSEILVVEADAATVEKIGPIPFTVTRSRVVEVIRSTSGKQAAGNIRLRQTGETGVSGGNSPVLMNQGQRYLVFANPLVINRETVPDVYQVVGDSAAFPEASQGLFDASTNRGGARMTGLPATLALADVRVSASRVPLRK
jgi:hypothetical protein